MAIDVTDVVAQHGAFYKAGTDAEKNLRSMLYKPSETAAFFQPRPTDDTKWDGTLSSLNRVVQPFQKAFTPISTIKFTPNSFPLYKLKIDISECPDELEATYMGFLAALPELDRSKWPFVKWLLEQHTIPRADQDMEEGEHFLGKFIPPTPGVPGAEGSGMNGIRENIRGYVTSGRVGLGNGPIHMGAIAADPADFTTQVEDFVRAIPKEFRKRLDFIFMNDDLALKYQDGVDAKYNKNYAQKSDKLAIDKFPNIKVQGLTSHGESEMIWASIPQNRINPIKKGSQKGTFKLESAKRNVDIYTDWHEALNFEVPEFVFVNDRDLA